MKCFILKGNALKEIHSILTEISGEHAPPYATVVIFPPVMGIVLDDQNCEHPGDY
jgi:hypothetical protein